MICAFFAAGLCACFSEDTKKTAQTTTAAETETEQTTSAQTQTTQPSTETATEKQKETTTERSNAKSKHNTSGSSSSSGGNKNSGSSSSSSSSGNKKPSGGSSGSSSSGSSSSKPSTTKPSTFAMSASEIRNYALEQIAKIDGTVYVPEATKNNAGWNAPLEIYLDDTESEIKENLQNETWFYNGTTRNGYNVYVEQSTNSWTGEKCLKVYFLYGQYYTGPSEL